MRGGAWGQGRGTRQGLGRWHKVGKCLGRALHHGRACLPQLCLRPAPGCPAVGRPLGPRQGLPILQEQPSAPGEAAGRGRWQGRRGGSLQLFPSREGASAGCLALSWAAAAAAAAAPAAAAVPLPCPLTSKLHSMVPRRRTPPSATTSCPLPAASPPPLPPPSPCPAARRARAARDPPPAALPPAPVAARLPPYGLACRQVPQPPPPTAG